MVTGGFEWIRGLQGVVGIDGSYGWLQVVTGRLQVVTGRLQVGYRWVICRFQAGYKLLQVGYR